jgi:hypothetical protein
MGPPCLQDDWAGPWEAKHRHPWTAAGAGAGAGSTEPWRDMLQWYCSKYCSYLLTSVFPADLL